MTNDVTLREVTAFLYENLNGFLATVEDGQPRVRAFQFMLEEDGRFYFCTSNGKPVYYQLRETPYIAFAVSTPDFANNLRLWGAITFNKDKKISEKLMNTYEFLRKLYSTPDNPEFEVFYLEHGTAMFWDFSGGSRSLIF